MENFLFGGGDFGVVVCVFGGVWWEASLMAKWLKPKGRQCFAIALLQKGFKENEKRGPTFSGWSFDEAYKLLVDDFTCNLEIPAYIHSRLLRKSIWECAKWPDFNKPSFGEDALIAEISRHEKQYLEQPKISFRLLSSVSVRGTLEPRPKKWMASVALHSGEKFIASRAAIQYEIEQSAICELPHDYQPVITTIKAREKYEAFDIGFRKFNLVRAIWNLYYNKKHPFQETHGDPSAYNKIVASPIHTLHGMRGNLATKLFHCSTDYTRPIRAYNWGPDLPRISKYFDEIQRRLLVHPARSLIEDCLIDYALALDSSEYETSFLRLWNVLERLVGSLDPVESKKKTIQRASFMFADAEFAESVLERLLARRNEIVHGRREVLDMERSMHYVRQCVERAIEFFLDNRFRFGSHAEFLDFLSLPRDIESVKRRAKLLSKVRSFLEPKRNPTKVEAPKFD
jgi:hypothetical protein